IDAFGLIASRHPHLHVAICGRGALADSLMARAREYEVQPRVHLLGLRSDISGVLAAADIFALPSLSEGMPLALLEAMFARCPIVASDGGDVSVALHNGHVRLPRPPGDPLSLAEAIDRLMVNPAEAHSLGERA